MTLIYIYIYMCILLFVYPMKQTDEYSNGTETTPNHSP